MYILYLYIIEKNSIYRYGIYLLVFAILLILDTIKLRKKAQESYTYSILMVVMIMAIFTGEYVTINAIISTLLLIAITLLIKKLKQPKNTKTTQQYSNTIKIGLYLAISNIIYLVMVLAYCKFI